MALSAADESWRVPRLLAVSSGLEYLLATRISLVQRKRRHSVSSVCKAAPETVQRAGRHAFEIAGTATSALRLQPDFILIGAQRCGTTSRMASDMPAVKLVVMLREPVERAFSAYKHEFARGYDSGRKPHWVRRAR
jgi:hypothetical protein